MKDKYYNLTEQYSNGVKDEAPEWMNTFFENREKRDVENPFKNSNNFLLDPSNESKQIKKCSICGSVLSNNEIDICSKCI